MPRTTSATGTSGRRRRSGVGGRSGPGSVVGQITQLVAANEQLQRENRELAEQNQRLRGELEDIGSALGLVSGPGRGRRGRGSGGAANDLVLGLVQVQPRRQRKPITDPAALERRRQALAKARAVRAEKRAAAAGASASE
ncbi:MAG TPA: hypothetical protein VOB72_16390 [Candidatus Dormibacteraeota bacterium]|nr:hypothetical protein [Candidatus Dormibacteraeota bacterium]